MRGARTKLLSQGLKVAPDLLQSAQPVIELIRRSDAFRSLILQEIYSRLDEGLLQQAYLTDLQRPRNLVVTFAERFSSRVQIALGEYADTWMQYLLSGGTDITIRVKRHIVKEALLLADLFLTQNVFCQYLAVAMGLARPDWLQIPTQAVGEFQVILIHERSSWESWVQNKIELRRLLYSRGSTHTRVHAVVKALIRGIKAKEPQISQHFLCTKLDSMADRGNPVPVPRSCGLGREVG
jgi:hypothetical protein